MKYVIILVILLILSVILSTYDFIYKRPCFANKMLNEERSLLINLLRITSSILNTNDIDWMPTGGSLLSIYRTNRLILKWDDDYDITISYKHSDKVVDILKQELPSHGCSIVFHRKWGGGHLYKIFFHDEHSKYIKTHRRLFHNTFKWPFIDLFIDCDFHKSNFSPYNIRPEEYPLQDFVVDGIQMKIPTNGNRTYEAFNKNGHIILCKEQSFSHKLEKICPCKGDSRDVLCEKLDLSY